MSDIGFWCTADRGVTYFNLNSGGVRAITFLRRIKTAPVKNKVITVTVQEKDPAGTLFVIPIVASLAHWIANSNAVSFISTNNIKISGSQVTIEFTSSYKNESSPVDGGDGYYYYDVYQSVDAGDSYGLYLKDGSGFSAITDVLRAGYCVFKTTVTLQDGGTWTVPGSIPSRSNATVFANWNSSSAVVVYNNMNKSLKVTGGKVALNIAVFSNGFPLVMSGAGFYVFNHQTKQCVYNSNYTPLFMKKTVQFNGQSVDTGVGKPMVAIGSIGMGGEKKGDYYQLYNKGIKMSGAVISSGRGGNTQYVYTQGFRIFVPDMSFPLVVCDGTQYFN
ncbi:DUF6453 family protein [Pantoea coffeiphila]|uniref:Uncharacterized protein n=1 Tax=Pantoea coffeiphila TaxID=1465635 RepID=A0A2S9I862_9GAMM|nr:DUF6453 family protein [Pantoea coffeiphila]PRD13966.1 hypothetical protein CQW29_18340 [Pantoea coffeiphila]